MLTPRVMSGPMALQQSATTKNQADAPSLYLLPRDMLMSESFVLAPLFAWALCKTWPQRRGNRGVGPYLHQLQYSGKQALYFAQEA